MQWQDREVSLLLVSGRILLLTHSELRGAFNSRLFPILWLTFSVVSAPFLSLFNSNFDSANLAFTLLVLIPLSIFLTFLIYFGVIEAALVFSKSRRLLIPEPLICILVALFIVPFQIGLSLVAGFKPLLGTELTAKNFIFCLFCMQVIVLTYANLLRPAIVRAQQDKPVAPQPNSSEKTRPLQMLLGHALISPDDLEMLEARDHYVAIITRNTETEVRARLKDLINSLGGMPGRQIHRSVWVHDAAVMGAKHQSDGLWLSLRSGRKVKVARPRQAEVEAWLRAGGRF